MLVHVGGTSTGYAANALRGLFLLLERVSQSFTSTKVKDMGSLSYDLWM